MNKLITYLKQEKYTLIFEVIVVVIGMVLALTADSIRDEYKENQKILEAFEKDKKNLLDAYGEIYGEVVSDVGKIEGLLTETTGVHDTINAFLSQQIGAEEFKTCPRCVLYVIFPLETDVEYKAFRKISTLPLYSLNSSYLNELEASQQNISLIDSVAMTNINIDFYYYVMEKFLDENMKDVGRDTDQNIAYLKTNYEGYHSLNTYQGINDFNVYSPIYLNMLRARMDLMEVYSENMNYILNEAMESTLPSLENSITVLAEDLNLDLGEVESD